VELAKSHGAPQGAHVRSNDYLDLINNPKVKEASVQALRKYGSGCSGSRLLNGTLDLHVRLEAELASFVHKAALIFSTGFQPTMPP
jgi:7-keto-8-aminopelargonate synthetase-like enzyme